MRPPLGRDYNAWQVAMQDFLAGRAAMIWSSTAFLRYVEENARFAVRAAPAPRRRARVGADRRNVLRPAPRAPPRAEKKAAWEFLRWMVGAEADRSSGPRAPATCRSRAPRSPSSPSPGYYARTPTIAWRSISSTRSSLGRGPPRCFACSARSCIRSWKMRCSLAGTRRDALAQARREAAMRPSGRGTAYLMLAPTLATPRCCFSSIRSSCATKQSFYAWDLLTPPTFVGMANYRIALGAGRALARVPQHAHLQPVTVVGSMSLGLAFALALDIPGRSRAFVRGAVFSAYVVSWVAVALLFMWLLDSDSGLVYALVWPPRAPQEELARRSRRRHLHARRGLGVEDHRLQHDHLPRRPTGHSPACCTRPRRSMEPTAGSASGASPGRCSGRARCSWPRRASSFRFRRSTWCGS